MKNKTKARDKKGPPPVWSTCGGCGATFTSRFAAKHHICPKEKRYAR